LVFGLDRFCLHITLFHLKKIVAGCNAGYNEKSDYQSPALTSATKTNQTFAGNTPLPCFEKQHPAANNSARFYLLEIAAFNFFFALLAIP